MTKLYDIFSSLYKISFCRMQSTLYIFCFPYHLKVLQFINPRFRHWFKDSHIKTKFYNPPLNILNRTKIVKRFFLPEIRFRSHREQLLRYRGFARRKFQAPSGGDAQREVPGGTFRPRLGCRITAQRPKFVRATSLLLPLLLLLPRLACSSQ